MRSISLLATAAALTAVLPQVGQSAETSLASLKSKARPIVVLSDSRDDPRVARQISALDGSGPELTKRNIKILSETDVHGGLHHQLGVEEKGFAVVLVGKDGTVKKIWRDPVAPKQIFTVIDSMPMRRNEMNG